MLRGVYEVLVGAQQNQVIPDAELPDQRVDGAYLYTRPTAQISEPCGGNMVLAVWLKQCE